MGKRIDLNEKRAARLAERGGEPTVIVIDEAEYVIADELPVALLDVIGDVQGGNFAAISAAMVAIFGEDTWEALRANHRLSIDDLVDILDDVTEGYGVTMGESSASPTSSTDTSTPSRPTSSGTTEPTSAPLSPEPATL